MHATVLTALVATLFGLVSTSDDKGAYPWGGGWVGFAERESGTPAGAGNPGTRGGTVSDCFSFRGANGETYVQCRSGPNGQANRFGTVIPGEGSPAVTPEMLLEEARRRLAPSKPKISTAPPRSRDGLVGLRHFFWIEPGQWHPISERATAGPVWAEVTATPVNLTIEPGSGQDAITCKGPGKPYDPKKPPGKQRTDCSLMFTRSSAGLPGEQYQVRASITWTADWVGSGGAGGPLPPVTTSITFPLRVAEGQALIQPQGGS
ncbi:hypothetical protein HII36_09615 [Nonomuraea sp. NN258]|uniref:hypothetical protein n=1 Tax=Nonomuraea antri TaxID=2730852 RepID=UPI00156855F6|nr:hypothetical protein [Nonomuraea antri]NRQ32093.1 hypothetical protein [Nonomuraea antri]